MKSLFNSLITILFLLCCSSLHAEEMIFSSKDGLKISGTLERGTSDKAIILFHQAGSSRGEYLTIAPRLQKMGYTTLSIDQRSGKKFAGKTNETAKRAKAKNLAQDFIDARPDLEAAILKARSLEGINKVIIWGSSYSAALSLVIAGSDTPKVDGVLAFSPGEYLPGLSVKKHAKNIKVPAFITSAKSEIKQWQAIADAIPDKSRVTKFHPQQSGRHGSSTLIEKRSSNAAEYWNAVEEFLKKNL